MTRAEPSTKITSLPNGHAAQVCAHSQHDEPLGLLDAVAVGLRIAERFPVDIFSFFDFVLCAVADENGFTTPFDEDVLAFGDAGHVDFDFGLREDVG